MILPVVAEKQSKKISSHTIVRVRHCQQKTTTINSNNDNNNANANDNANNNAKDNANDNANDNNDEDEERTE